MTNLKFSLRPNKIKMAGLPAKRESDDNFHSWQAGIFAAGEGLRLKKDFPGEIKPMIKISGKPLLEWMVIFLRRAGIRKITILLNSKGIPAKKHLMNIPEFQKDLDFIIKDTASSWESFSLLSKTLSRKAENFLLAAVDSFYKPEELEGMLKSFPKAELVLGVTDRIHDEKPLWADINGDGLVTKIGADCVQKKFITSGIYRVSKKLCGKMPSASNYKALRDYLADLAKSKTEIFSYAISDSADVDGKSDILLAENFIKSRFQNLI